MSIVDFSLALGNLKSVRVLGLTGFRTTTDQVGICLIVCSLSIGRINASNQVTLLDDGSFLNRKLDNNASSFRLDIDRCGSNYLPSRRDGSLKFTLGYLGVPILNFSGFLCTARLIGPSTKD